ncbi:hypothetical protein OROGR_010927 [Orobanche gracilis]
MRGGIARRHGGMKEPQQQKPHIENKIIKSSPRAARLREELLSKIVPWEKITVPSLDKFPYYIDQHSKNLLLECVASHMKHHELRKYRGVFQSSGQRILLKSIRERERERLTITSFEGTETYLEKLVSALARELQVPLLNLEDEHLLGDIDDLRLDDYYTPDSCEDDLYVHKKFKKGDRVQYTDYQEIPDVNNRRILSIGQRGEVYEVDGKRIAVAFNLCGLKTKDPEMDEISTQTFGSQALVTWLDANSIREDVNARAHDCHIAMDVLYEVLESKQPVIVYFPDTFWRPAMSDSQGDFLEKVKRICRKLSGVVMICPQHIEMKKHDQHLRPLAGRYWEESPMYLIFTNVVCMKPPEDEDLLNTFNTQIEEDRLRIIPRSNLNTMHKVLKEHNLVCMNLEHANIEDEILTKQKVEKIVGWATSHYLSSCPLPCINEGKLHIPYESIKLSMLRLKEEETPQPKKRPSIKDLATGHEELLVSAVVCPEDNDLEFDDVGGLENVKRVLYETAILPMKRPELFSRGSLLRPCRGILLFGPPGTGKSLLAKAIATEIKANFINFSAASITNKWFEETSKALFSYAKKLAPVVIYLDEVDSLLGARGKNETSILKGFVAAWDGLESEESQRVLVIGGTNRPFDIDEAVISRMPRRIYVGLPDVENRSKILKVLLDEQNLESGFSFEQLAEATDGYSGSDLKNLCVAAAYRPIEDLLEQESKGGASDEDPALRPINLNDFIHSKAKVRPSVAPNASSINMLREWSEQYGER